MGDLDPMPEWPGNPEVGPPVSIVEVRDARVFRGSYSSASWKPSLHPGRADEPNATSRAVGRRRNRRGGNLWLPEERPVETLVGEALTAGFQAAGFRVLPEDDQAVPVRAEIIQLWTWDRRRLGSNVRYEFWAQVRVMGEVPPFQREGGAIVCGFHLVAAGGPSKAVWTRVIERGLADLADDLRQRLQGPHRRHICTSP